MQNQQEITPYTEPVRNNFDSLRGPFQYLPFTIDHPGQPEDDSNSVKDPTIKTFDRSRIIQSPYHTEKRSSDKLSLIQEPSSLQIIAFSNKSQATSIGFGQKKLKSKYQEIIKQKLRLNDRMKKFLFIYDLEQFEIINAFIMQPSSKFLKFWNIFYLSVLMFQFIIIPLHNMFALMGFLVIKMIDCIIQSFSAIAINGEMQSNFYQIFKNYYKTQLIFDMIFSICLAIIIGYQQNSWIEIIISLLTSIPRLLDLQQKIQFDYNIFNKYYLLLCQVIKVVIIIHILTCFWLENFLDQNENPNVQEYIHSLFHIINILSGNSTRINETQTLEVIAYCVINLIFFFVFIQIFTQLLSVFQDDQNLSQLSQFMSQNNLDSILKQKIISHLFNQPKYLHNQFISKLSQKLVQEYNLQQRLNVLNKYFKYYNHQTIKELIHSTVEIVCQPNQTIIQEGTLDDCSLYFILEGSVYLQTGNNIKIQTLQKSDWFGEIAFYTERPRNFTVKSEGVTRLLKVSRQTFMSLLSFNDKQLFNEKKDKILFEIEMPIKCNCCQSYQHILTSCPLLSYRPDRALIAKRYTFPYQQLRVEHKRKNFKDIKAYQFYQQASQYEVAFLQLFSDQLQVSQLSQSQLPYDEVPIRDSYLSARSLSKVSKEKSIVKSTSFLRQQSAFEQNSLPTNNDNIFYNVNQENEFQILNSGPNENKFDEFASLVRTDQQKRTFATAGFGSQSLAASNNNVTQKSLNIIMENDDSESVSEIKSKSNENIEDSPQDKFTRQHNDPKLTFNYNFETQMNELQKQNQNLSNPKIQRIGSGSLRQQSSRNSSYKYPDAVSSRQNSSRSLTYSPNNSQQISIFSQQQNVRKSTFSFPQKIIQQAKQIEISNINDESRSQQQRPSIRKFSTKTGTKLSVIPSSFQPFSTTENPVYANNSFGFYNFESMCLFDLYLPHNNYTISIFKANKYKNLKTTHISKYISDYKISKMIQQLRLKKIKTMKVSKTFSNN